MLMVSGALATALAGCAGAPGAGADGGGDGGYLRALQGRGLTLPQHIPLADFNAAARGLGITEPAEFLSSMGVPVRGAGAGRWLARADLLRACGPDCSRRDGLGELLLKFAVVFHRNN